MAGARSETGVTTRVRFAPLEGGNGPFAVFAGNPRDLGDAGYVETELAAAGTATSFAADGDLTGDGRWTVRPDTTADFTTRVLIRRPADPAALQRHLGRRVVQRHGRHGHGRRTSRWSAPRSSGAATPTSGSRPSRSPSWGARRPSPWKAWTTRSASAAPTPSGTDRCNHPGDAFSYDIFSQIGRTLRGPDSPLHRPRPPSGSSPPVSRSRRSAW